MFLSRWIKPGARLRIVDLATGSGDIPRLVASYGRQMGAELRIDALDQQSSTLEIARKLSVQHPEINLTQGNILEWNTPEPYDLVLCNLVLHHFSEDDAVRALQHCRKLSRRFVLISDLRRSLFLAAGVYLLTELIFREPMTKYDARLSAARAFSFAEMNQLAQRAGWTNFGHKTFPFARQAIWLE
jgi:2-polyprenyl-3-methyl-5-hydroxy-6-metoxy-1,4-benzoquinol methylase